jgi:hypothetical protein
MSNPAAAVQLATAARVDEVTGSADPSAEVKPRALSPERSAPSKGASPFAICDRPHKGSCRGRVVETGLHLLPDAHSAERISRARVSGFGRDAHPIDPKDSEGCLARVQSRTIGAAKRGDVGLSRLARTRAGVSRSHRHRAARGPSTAARPEVK